MADSRRLDPGAVTALLRRRWKNGHRRWLDDDGTWPLGIGLSPPTERETTLDLDGVRRWIEAWAAAAGSPEQPGELVWTERQWPGLGRQRLPERLLLSDPDAVAAWAGEAARWGLARERAERLRSEAGWSAQHCPQDSEEAHALRLGRHFDWLADAPEADYERLLAVLRWLMDHPSSGLYVRQLPVPGIDTKWIGANRGRLLDLLSQCLARDGDLHQLAGLRREPDLLRLRLLDPGLRAAAGELGDITAPVEQIAALPIQPERVFIVENLQTGLAFNDLPGSLCLMARGYAVEPFGTIPWLQGRHCHYWGDLDTHGFAILNRLRQHLPHAHSLLMDAATLHRHRELWQREDKPAPGPLHLLTQAEQDVFEGLSKHRWGQHVRLEQERIDWGHAWSRILAL